MPQAFNSYVSTGTQVLMKTSNHMSCHNILCHTFCHIEVNISKLLGLVKYCFSADPSSEIEKVGLCASVLTYPSGPG